MPKKTSLVDRLVNSAGRMAQAEYELGVAIGGAYSNGERNARRDIANASAARFYRVAQQVIRDARRLPLGEKR